VPKVEIERAFQMVSEIAPKRCISAPKEDPTSKLAQGIELFYKLASEVGSRSAPIGTQPCLVRRELGVGR